MKKRYLFTLLLLQLMTSLPILAQVCQVDSQYTSPGIYPSDTLADLVVGISDTQVVQFVFPSDTVLFGQTIAFDSFRATVPNIPAGLAYACNQNFPTCTYVTNPPNLTRGCATITGIPTSATAAYPAYDSIIVEGIAYITVFGSAQSLATPISIYYRVLPVGIEDPLAAQIGLTVSPNPAYAQAALQFTLPRPGQVRISVHNLLGEEVGLVHAGKLRSGPHHLAVPVADLPPGCYLLRLELDRGAAVTVKKLLVVR